MKTDSFFEAEHLIKKHGVKKALQTTNTQLWARGLTNIEKAHKRAVMYYIENIGARRAMIKIVLKNKNK